MIKITKTKEKINAGKTEYPIRWYLCKRSKICR